MKTSTQERYKVIDFIIKTIGDKGREIQIDYLSNLVDNEFNDKSIDEREFYVYFDSQINILCKDYKLIRKEKTLIDLTDKGIEVYESSDGFYEYLESVKRIKKKQDLSLKMSIAGGIATVLATLFAACTFWLTYNNLHIRTNLIVFGLACFILGFVLRDLIMNLLSLLCKYRK